jgi:hypothetical protein
MTTTDQVEPEQADATITISLNYRDAQKYTRNAAHPAHPYVLARIREALESEPWASRVSITIPVETARIFIRKSTRPIRLWTGQTMKSLLQMAVAEYDEQHPAGEAAETSATEPATEPVEPEGPPIVREPYRDEEDEEDPEDDDQDPDGDTESVIMEDVVDAPPEGQDQDR